MLVRSAFSAEQDFVSVALFLDYFQDSAYTVF